MMSKKYFHAIATLMGTIIGVGMFSVPFVVYQSGVFLFLFYIIFLGAIQFFMHLAYAEIVLSTKKRHRVPGYVEEYYGKRFKKVALVVALTSMNLSLLAYIIIGGIFLYQIFSPGFGGTQFFYSFLMILLTAGLTYKGVRLIASLELFMSALLFFVIGIIVYQGFPHIEMANYSTVSFSKIFLPYGPIFMAIGGMSAVPTVCQLLAHKKDNIKSAIFWGTFIPVVITIVFVLTVVGVTGPLTSVDSLSGLQGNIGNGALIIALIFGLFSVITSLLMTVQATREIYWLDLKMDKMHSWFLSLLVPFLLIILGVNNLTSVVSLSGAVVGGVVGLIYIFLILKVKERPQRNSFVKVKIGHKSAFALSLLFIFGFLNVFEYVGLKTVTMISLVLFTYLYALIKSNKYNTSIYLELLDTSKKVTMGLLLVFVILLTYGVFSIII